MRKGSGRIESSQTIVSGQCWYLGFEARGGTTEGGVFCYDNPTTAAGDLVESFTMGASGIFGNRDIPDPDGVYCASGLYASLSGGVSSAIIYYRRNPLVNGSWGIKG